MESDIARRFGETGMGRLVRAHDWSRTLVGPIERWPKSLLTAVSMLLDCKLPMYLAWGPEHVQFYNDAYRPILGFRHPAALGASAPDTWPEIWPTIGPMWQQVLAGQSIGYDHFKLTIERYGFPEDTYFNFSYSPVPDDEGRPAGVLVAFVETTNLLVAERRARFQLELSDGLRGLDSPDDITGWTCTLLGKHLDARRAGYATIEDGVVNIALRGWHDGSVESVLGQQVPLDAFGAGVAADLRAGLTVRLDDVHEDPRTTERTAIYDRLGAAGMLIVPLNRDGRLIAVVAVSSKTPRKWTDEEATLTEDAAERTRAAVERAIAEIALKRRLDGERELLRETDRRKDEFLAMLAHELRNPLAPISTAAHLLQSAALDEQRVREVGTIVARQVSHMKSLVDDLLDVSRVTRGLITLDDEVLSMAMIVASAVEQARPLIEARRHHLSTRDDAPGTYVRGDRTRLVQVLVNLLANAAKYTPEGGEIRLETRKTASDVQVEVADNGTGIASDLLPRVFELFTQGERTPDRSHGGLGLGLALVKSLVELHGGSVQAHSDGAGRGSRFVVNLPTVEAQPTTHDANAATASAVTSPRRILVVDDNVDAGGTLAVLLRAIGHDVAVEHDAYAAIDTATAGTFDVFILDIGMPGMDGYELIGVLKQLPQHRGARFVALTGYGQPGDIERARAAGFDRHFVKPFDPGDLQAMIAAE